MRDWEKHVKVSDSREAWCGEAIGGRDWAFVDATHALLAIEQGSLTFPCRKCLKRIRSLADEGLKAYDGEEEE